MASNKNLLVIRLSAMGDVAMTVPVLSALTQEYPHLKITVLTKPFFKPMFAQLQNVDIFDAEVKGRHKGIFGIWKLYRELRSLHIDMVADLHNVLRSKILKLFFRSIGVPVVQIDKGRAEKKALTTSKNKIFVPLKTTHERYADVFGKLGFPINLSDVPSLHKEKLSEEILNLMNSNGRKKSESAMQFGAMGKPNPQKKYLGIAPFAAFEGKTYPLPLMERVIEQLDASEKYEILLFGGGGKEKQQLQELASRFKCCVNVAGKLSFSEELALISHLDAMLSMDSGNGHLAAMYGIPVVTLWGVTHPYTGFYPFGQDADNALLADREKFPLIPTSVYGNKMPEGYENAMETISSEDVVNKIEQIIK
ncbi:MAG: glycosyltransferase family 9 protein [Pricia sp.]